MILVGDIGSTKADWCFVDGNGNETKISSIGVNPNLHTEVEIRTVIEGVCPEQIPSAKVEAVFYYGTGIWDYSRKELLHQILSSVFQKAHIEVHHDLLGAARALCGNEKGIACILGTGSNSCLYSGHEVIDNVTNLGWLVGDEGSGVDLGKRLVRAYSYRELPAEVKTLFEEYTNLDATGIGNGLYGAGNANKFLASFSHFLSENQEEPALRQLIVESFTAFIRSHVMKYTDYKTVKVNFVGSIAYHYKHILMDVCLAEGLKLGHIIQKPISALVTYHSKAHNFAL